MEKFIRECAVMAAFLFLIFILENYDYFFHYVPHREDYTVVEAQKTYIQSNKGFDSRKTRVVYYIGPDKYYAKVPRDAGDKHRESVRVAYSGEYSILTNEPKVVRVGYVVQTELIVIGILVIILQIRRYIILRKYWEELIEFPKQIKK